MENTVRHLGFVDGLWLTASLYETNNESAIVHTTKFEEKDHKTCLEWARYEFSGISELKQL